MDALVLDTNIVSYLMKGHRLASPYRRHLEGRTLAISFMTVAELHEGAYRRNWGKSKMASLASELKKYLVIPYTPKACELWGKIRDERKHRTIAVDDAWIAATALAHDCPLATHNPKDFADISGLDVITEQRDRE